jgi:ribosomal-protein-alanine N-acetyltransferase
MINIPTLQSERLLLRPLRENDIVPLQHIMGKPDMLRYFPNQEPPATDKVARLIASQIEHWNRCGYGWWAVDFGQDGEFIGWAGLQYLPETDETEIAYLLDSSYWGRGLGTEAARVGVRYGFEEIDLDQIVAIVHPENIASQRVAQKAGLVFTIESVYFGMDCFRYELSRKDFDDWQLDQ